MSTNNTFVRLKILVKKPFKKGGQSEVKYYYVDNRGQSFSGSKFYSASTKLSNFFQIISKEIAALGIN